MNLQGKSILLTGASGGIGAELAVALSQAGSRLLLTGRDANKLNNTLSKLAGSGHQAIAADLTSASDRVRLADKAQQLHVNVLINLAGCNEFALLVHTETSEIEQQIQTNLLVPITLCQILAPVLATQPESAIVNVGSILGSIGVAGSSVYCASKFGLRGFSEALRREYADTHLTVLYVAPRATETAMNSIEVQQMNAELGSTTDAPERVAHMIVQSLQRNRRERYIGWPERMFVRLNALFPKLVDRAMLKQLPTIRNYAMQSALDPEKSAEHLPKNPAFN